MRRRAVEVQGSLRRSQGAPRHARAPGEGSLRPRADETLDTIGVGAIPILQKRAGYRFNLDPLLLADFAARVGGTRGPVIDLGTGSGIIPILLARRHGRGDLFGLEIQPSLYDAADRNVRLNGCARQVQLALGDLKHVSRLFAAESFGMVVANPPYGARRTGRVSPTAEKAIARHEVLATLADYVGAARHLLADRGAFKVIYPAARLAELMQRLCAERLRPRLLRPVHPRADAPANRVLLEAVKGGRERLQLLPPLVLHRDLGSAFTEEVSALIG